MGEHQALTPARDVIGSDGWFLGGSSTTLARNLDRLRFSRTPLRVVGVFVVGYLVVAAAGLLAAAVVGLADGALFDESRFMAAVVDARSDAMTSLAGIAGSFTDTWTVIGCATGAGVILLALRLWPQLTVLLGALTLELCVFLTISFVVDRPRPDVATTGAVPSTASMPSGHVAAAVVIYGGLAVIVWSLDEVRSHRVLAVVGVVTISLMVAASRVYEGLHHPSDVVVGALVGAGSLVVAVLAAGQIAAGQVARGQVDRDHVGRRAETSPPASHEVAPQPTTGSFASHIPRPSHVLLRSRPVFIVTVVLGVTLGIVAAVEPGWLLAIDEPVARAIRGEALVDFFRFWTRFGSQQNMIIAASALGVLLWQACRPFALALPAAVVAGVILDVVLKVTVDRPRPPDPLVGTALGSFPSGHALTGVIFFGVLPPALWIGLRRRLVFWASVPLSIIAATLVALSRVYLGGHWPSDVVASALLGAGVLLGTELALGTDFARRHCRGCPLHPDRPC